jgi:hypothetical protein
MDALSILLIVLVIAATAVCAVAVFALLEAIKTLRSVGSLTRDLDERLLPLIEKADVTVDAFNAELLRVDAIVTQVEEVTDRVSSTSAAVHGVVSAPMDAVNAVGGGLRDALKSWRRTHNR